VYAAVPVESELPRGSNVQYARSSRCPFLCKFNVIRKTASRRHRLKDAHHPAVIVVYNLIFYNLYCLIFYNGQPDGRILGAGFNSTSALIISIIRPLAWLASALRVRANSHRRKRMYFRSDSVAATRILGTGQDCASGLTTSSRTAPAIPVQRLYFYLPNVLPV